MENNKNELSVIGGFITDKLTVVEKDNKNNNATLIPVEYDEYGVVNPGDNTVVVISGNKKYELLPIEQTKDNFYSKFIQGDRSVLSDDYVYRVNPMDSTLKLNTGFNLPDTLGDANAYEISLMVANHENSIQPYKEKKLTKESAPEPLIKNIKYRLFLAALAMFISFVATTLGFATWHIYILAGIYALVHLLNAATTAYYTQTRNFKVFSGVITNIYTKFDISPSLRRSYIQISNGRKFITFPYQLSRKHNFKNGIPVTIFIPNNAKIKESEMGPMVDYLLGISFSIDIKSADKNGEYQDNTIKHQTTEDFFED